MTALNKQALRSKARSASAGEWIKEPGDGWEAICSADDQANGNFIIAHFEGPDAQANREFVQAANPDTVLVLLDALEAAEKRMAELEARDITIEPFRSFVTNDDLAALHRFAECCDDPESGGHDLEKEQVRRLEAIGALQRSGRISYITGFGDVLISITAGIGVKGE